MSLVSLATKAVERLPIADPITRAGVNFLVGRTRRQLAVADFSDEAFIAELDKRPIAINTAEANAQHYEIPAAFFARVLGPRRKYSSCLYVRPDASLAEAEECALAETAAHADLHDGQSILELGCGWGSLSLWMAERLPKASITAVSNSHSQRAYIEAEAARRGFQNLTVITADINDFAPTQTFDRVVSVEMFEHMSNWRALLTRVRSWIAPDGLLFIHIFAHRSTAYLFSQGDSDDWIGQHFFTGGIMPSHSLIRSFSDLFAVEEEWRWSGTHYARTARHWLENFDRAAAETRRIFDEIYGEEAPLFMRRWRLFFLATEGLFGNDNGNAWGASHYRLRPQS
ncbi:cyclopropane-fatty-acyl-phospholipid synthase family protein [Terrarubrum flagellatum]|uniref:SAM-dependent methyltransferase n=1 Tax=Terrirubrum flagellatum TaxID=2895980 RepID=UPI00314521B9